MLSIGDGAEGYRGVDTPIVNLWIICMHKLVDNVAGKPSRAVEIYKHRWAAGALPRTPPGELTALPRPPIAVGEGFRCLLSKSRMYFDNLYFTIQR